ncbi:hypothetical protein ACVINW_003837 [Bradyrhizobium sp. USDA 4461]
MHAIGVVAMRLGHFLQVTLRACGATFNLCSNISVPDRQDRMLWQLVVLTGAPYSKSENFKTSKTPIVRINIGLNSKTDNAEVKMSGSGTRRADRSKNLAGDMPPAVIALGPQW